MIRNLPPAITMLMAAAIACGSIASAQQPSAGTPFAQAIKISAVVSKPAAIKGGDYDDRMQKISLRMKFANSDLRQTYDGYTAIVSILGQSAVDSKVRQVILQEKVALSIPPGKAQDHACEEVITRFDKTDAKFGYAYDGWIVVVKDGQGKVVLVKSTSALLEKLPELAANLALNGCYTAKLKPCSNPARSGN